MLNLCHPAAADSTWADDNVRMVLDAAPNGMVMIDREGRILLVNAQTEALFGYSRAELLGQPVELLVPDRFRNDHPSKRSGFFADPVVRSMGAGRDLYGQRKDGSEFPVEIGLTPIETDEGLLVLSAIVDITARKRAEEKFRMAVESAPNGMVMIDREGRILLVNAHAEALFGYSRAELMGQSVELLVPERYRNRHPDQRSSFFANPMVRSLGAGCDLFGRRKDGSEFPVEIGLTPIATDDGMLVLSAIVDITARKRVEAEIRRLNEDLEQRVLARTAELEATNKELEAFSYSVSHDLRAPLRAIVGFSGILISDFAMAMPDEARSYLDDVRSSAQQMGHLVDDLLAFSRLGRLHVRKQPIVHRRLVQQCLDELRKEHHGRNVQIHLGSLADCQADPVLLKQVWMNLLSNALKYTGKRDVAVIEIGCRDGDKQVEREYFVKDNGVGFDMRYAGKLFGVFQRLHRSEEYPGTGVGLAIVQRIVQRHGGNVWADALPEQGATFCFTLGGVTSPVD